MLDPQEVYLNSNDPKTERIAHVYEIYPQGATEANALTSTISCSKPCGLLKSVAEVRDYYNRRFRYVLVDEYQDTEPPQYELMRLLGQAIRRVCRWR